MNSNFFYFFLCFFFSSFFRYRILDVERYTTLRFGKSSRLMLRLMMINYDISNFTPQYVCIRKVVQFLDTSLLCEIMYCTDTDTVTPYLSVL